MRSTDIQDELAEGFEPAPLPPIGPDGAPAFAAERPPISSEPPPRLCEAGPCRHYHRFRIHMDVQQPMPIRKADGSFERAPDLVHMETHHYCYPTVGVEMKLGRLPVLQCNRWQPVGDSHSERVLARDRDAWLKTPDGNLYLESVKAWESRRQAELELGASSLDGAPLAEFALYVQFEPHLAKTGDHLSRHTVELSVSWEATMAEVVLWAIDVLVHSKSTPSVLQDRWSVATLFRLCDAEGHHITNMSATVAHLGLEPGATLTLLRNEETAP